MRTVANVQGLRTPSVNGTAGLVSATTALLSLCTCEITSAGLPVQTACLKTGHRISVKVTTLSLTSSACNSHCDTCSGRTNYDCLTCATNSYNAFAYKSGYCDAQCPSHWYDSGNKTCAGMLSTNDSLECHEYCGECF